MNNTIKHGKFFKAQAMVSILIFSVIISTLSVIGDEGSWTMYRYDDKRTGNSPLTSNIITPEIKWTFLTGGDVKSPPAVGDINDDGEFEVVFGSNDKHLYALDRYGNELWNFSVLGSIVSSPTIGDVDGDGLNEIIFGGYYPYNGDPNLYVLNGEDGSLLWQFESANYGGQERGFQASAILHDINDDGINDILIGSMDHYFYALNGPDGDVIWSSEVFEHFIRSSSPIGDLDNDGDLEVVVADNHALIRTYDAETGALEWERDIGYGMEATPILADVDGDGYDEIILFTVVFWLPGGLGDVVVLNHDGTDLWRSSVHTLFYTSPTILDIDGDGLVDIIGGDTNDHTLIAYKGTNGALLWETVLPDSTWSQAPLITADIDSDGVIEVIAGANPNLYCLSTDDGEIEWIFETPGHIWGQPIVADLEQDGFAEVIFGSSDDYLYVLGNGGGPKDLKKEALSELESFEYEGGKCKGLTSLTLEYLGGVGADITVEKGMVADNGDGTYTITPADGKSKLGANTKIFVDGELYTEIHTSCSKPLDVGGVFGDFTVIGLDKILKRPKEIQNAIDHIKQSLNINPKDANKPWKKRDLWLDETHLDPKYGKYVFYEEKKAVEDLMKAAKCKGIKSLTLENTGPGAVIEVTKGGVFGPQWVDPGEEFTILPEDGKTKLGSSTVLLVDGKEVTIHTSCSKPIDVGDVHDELVITALDKTYKDGWSAALEELSRDVIDKLVEADKILAETALEEALNTLVQNSKHQDKYDKEIEKAQEEMLKAEEELAKGKPDKAIDHYKKGWEHAQKAIKHAEKK